MVSQVNWLSFIVSQERYDGLVEHQEREAPNGILWWDSDSLPFWAKSTLNLVLVSRGGSHGLQSTHVHWWAPSSWMRGRRGKGGSDSVGRRGHCQWKGRSWEGCCPCSSKHRICALSYHVHETATMCCPHRREGFQLPSHWGLSTAPQSLYWSCLRPKPQVCKMAD